MHEEEASEILKSSIKKASRLKISNLLQSRIEKRKFKFVNVGDHGPQDLLSTNHRAPHRGS